MSKINDPVFGDRLDLACIEFPRSARAQKAKEIKSHEHELCLYGGWISLLSTKQVHQIVSRDSCDHD
jgi:hypothetical protein